MFVSVCCVRAGRVRRSEPEGRTARPNIQILQRSEFDSEFPVALRDPTRTEVIVSLGSGGAGGLLFPPNSGIEKGEGYYFYVEMCSPYIVRVCPVRG